MRRGKVLKTDSWKFHNAETHRERGLFSTMCEVLPTMVLNEKFS
jgi:hypothetical protein